MNNDKLTMTENASLSCFDGHDNPPVQYSVHCPMEDVLGYIRGHWTPPPGNCLHHIAPAADRVIDLGTQKKEIVAIKATLLKQ